MNFEIRVGWRGGRGGFGARREREKGERRGREIGVE